MYNMCQAHMDIVISTREKKKFLPFWSLYISVLEEDNTLNKSLNCMLDYKVSSIVDP